MEVRVSLPASLRTSQLAAGARLGANPFLLSAGGA